MFVIVPALIMIAIAVYAITSVAADAATIPLQWSPSGQGNFLVPRLFAFALLPVIGIVVLLILPALGIASSTAMVLVAILFVAIQVLHIGLTQRWYSRTRA